ncbi:hypothetical protein [Aureimonas mangrovi]|uniref:hypothetical protein n=1 Tax=Aureimonas mangrovi TaxID=2758041 RepID=UPI00163D55DE|nr:hypothetical protein [Aureimonas mangrovi]
MEHLVAIMLLVGCNADGSQCSEIPVPAPAYDSVADCEREMAIQMRFSSTYDDRILGKCTAVSEELLDQSATIEWGVSRGGELRVEIMPEVEDTIVVSQARSAGQSATATSAVR